MATEGHPRKEEDRCSTREGLAHASFHGGGARRDERDRDGANLRGEGWDAASPNFRLFVADKGLGGVWWQVEEWYDGLLGGKRAQAIHPSSRPIPAGSAAGVWEEFALESDVDCPRDRWFSKIIDP